jgi:putative FmdB family regulatory protein
MPVYEFLCEDCNRVFSFLARTAGASKRKARCPKCGGMKMSRRLSRFAVARKSTGARSSKEPDGAASGSGDMAGAGAAAAPDMDPRTEAAMEDLARDFGNIDENNPRQVAAAMRRLSAATGEPLDPAMDEAVRRLEAGEDPEKVEEAMADAFPDGGASDAGGTPTQDGGLYDL